MTKHSDEMADLVGRAALQARLELVSADLESAAERLAAVIAEIKGREEATGDGPGADR